MFTKIINNNQFIKWLIRILFNFELKIILKLLEVIIKVKYFFLFQQLKLAEIISTIYGLIMGIVLVGIVVQISEDGLLAPSTLLFFIITGQIIIAGLLHPREVSCLICIVIYYLTVPSMYMLLIIFALFNLHNISWGTRDAKPPVNPNTVRKFHLFSHFLIFLQ